MHFQLYLEQIRRWPAAGQHIMAHYDDEAIYVYQAYGPAIADYAVNNQKFGGNFSFDRMSWIKPNFLWMMFRSSWARKVGQERILAIRLRRTFFDELVASAVASSFSTHDYVSQEEWRKEIIRSDVRLQWDPDHDPTGVKVERRALQVGLQRRALQRYSQEELLSIEDITWFVIEQRKNVTGGFQNLIVPTEFPYPSLSKRFGR